MRLTRLILDDVGAYGGHNEFEFPTTSDRPIVLYGGTNGAGKSTLFEAIPLCLYGQSSMDEKMTKKQYNQKIRRLFHRHKHKKTQAGEASVSLEFEYAQNGRILQYKITRNWQNNDGRIDEFLALYKQPDAGKGYVRVDAVGDSQIQMMINQMIPRAVAGMFFFDGERIKDIAEEGDEHLYIKSSFDSLLGLDISDRLRDDIGTHILRNSGEEDKEVLARIEEMNREKDEAERRLEEMQQKRTFLSDDISSKKKELDGKEEKFFRAGGSRAKDRERLVDERDEISKSLNFVESQIRDMIKKDLPLAIVPDQLRQVREKIQEDEDSIKSNLSGDTVRAAYDHMIGEFEAHLDLDDPETKRALVKKLRDIADARTSLLSDKRRLTFDFSLSEMAAMRQRIGRILDQDHERWSAHHESHKHYSDRLGRISAQLDIIPQQDEVGPLYSSIKEITLEMGEMEQECHTLEMLEAQEKSKIVLLNSKIRKHLAAKRSNHRNQLGLELAPRIQDALEEYSARLRAKKITLLESNILEGIKRCFHKSRLITAVSIDPQTYRITLYSREDEISRDTLSQGELQLYVTAIVWGLAKTSGRPLPLIVDTPLARLDVEHRENLIRNFYPEASHQIIIFSTNTEVVDSYYEMIRPHVSQAMLIQYDPKSDTSVVSDGYFGSKEGS